MIRRVQSGFYVKMTEIQQTIWMTGATYYFEN